MIYEKCSRIRASADTVFAFHELPDALSRLQPPWQKTEIIELPASLEVGARAHLRVRLAPFVWQTIEAVHVEYDPPRMFADKMLRGPFPRWLHKHIVEPVSATECRLIDRIDFELPLGVLGNTFGPPIARWQLNTLFNFRHEVTRKYCEAQ